MIFQDEHKWKEKNFSPAMFIFLYLNNLLALRTLQ